MDFGSIAHYKPFHKGCRVDEVGLVVDGCFVDWGAWNQCAARDGVGFLVKVLNANEGGVLDKLQMTLKLVVQWTAMVVGIAMRGRRACCYSAQ